MKINKLKIDLNDKTLVDIGFEIKSSLALVGQSGSGKSLSIKALLNMLPNTMTKELSIDADFELVAGKTLGFVPQNPFTALSPLTKIKKQFFTSQERVDELFEHVGLDASLQERFPPELSGGQLQRVVIAMALEGDPKLLMLDEPTTALDPNTRILILDLLKELQKEYEFKILFVTHDMNSAKSLCEDICVIKDGSMVEYGKMQDILQSPKEKYTQTLIEANFANRDFRK
ncbi:ATP-binding cassette domain-containing protein [Sulfurimonas lithotrophica]|uniref:ATP-binding cassette domain-containing protein n=1 Tax=Sulfurimonas lithotrophica TaxID=2590022 RepID=A0A5P8P378_9BACT|nr:ATP-binding cassette domain-containing protein [Sulfurimonas lithotrophica]QFR50213.1 ATP-binding cassette domain-containing protein [Sulfurimonas lithotrophica]